MTIDVDRLRADTPGCEHVAHFNNAGAALPPRPVLQAVFDHLNREAEIGGYEAAAEREDRIEHTYDAMARLLGCDRDEVAIVENATRAWDMAFYSFRFEPGDRILTSNAEYASNYIALKQVTDRAGAEIVVIPDDEHGQVDTQALATMLEAHGSRTKLVSLVHVPSQGGLVNPAAEVGRLTRAAGVPFLLDSCQAAGQMPLDVRALGCDVLTGTGRKFMRAPRGTGFMYVRRELTQSLEPPLLDLHSADWQPDASYRIRPDARRFENWEGYVAGKIGLGVAADYALSIGLEAIRDRVYGLAADLRERLSALPGVTVHDLGREKCAIVTFSHERTSATEMAAKLRRERVNVSVLPASWARLDFGRRGLDEVVRASVHYYNTETELERLIRAVSS
jgi:selenocysteine lyase/cysteine desulfurase